MFIHFSRGYCHQYLKQDRQGVNHCRSYVQILLHARGSARSVVNKEDVPHVFQENSNKLLINTVSSSYPDYNADFKRQVYISRIAIYDENKNLMGIATLSNPILKEEAEDYAFKLKIDI